jgi:hypothetical protein
VFPSVPDDRYSFGLTDIGGLSMECQSCEQNIALWVKGPKPSPDWWLDNILAHESEVHGGPLGSRPRDESH